MLNFTEEQVLTIQKHMEAAQARQKSYADRRRTPLEFEVGDFVYLKVSGKPLWSKKEVSS